ncbi:MAG: ABC transporter permease [Smithellaceae bacterium]|nr:ABC transporter permease [Smithellaceae bacterium]
MKERNTVSRPKDRQLLWHLLSFALFFGLWEVAGRWPISAAFPPFSQTMLAFGRMTLDGSFLNAYASTSQPLLIGFVLCGIIGVGFGIWMGLSRAVEWLSLPVFVILQAAPMAAVVPLVTYIYGIGLTSKVLAVVILAAPVIVMNSYKGIRNTNPSLIQMCRSFQGSQTQVVMKIVLPHAAAMIFTALRLGLAMGFVGVVIAELLITPTGIGDLITYHSSVADFPEMFAAVFSIIAIAALTLYVLERIQRRLFPPELQG